MTEKINRRSLIKGLAALPMAMAAEPQQTAQPQRSTQGSQSVVTPGCPPKSTCLSFHGVWAFVFKPAGIWAVTPCVEEHSYWIGDGQQTHHLLRGKYRLDGVSAAQNAPSIIGTATKIGGVEAMNFAPSYLWINLPFPKKITASGLSYVGGKLKAVSASTSNLTAGDGPTVSVCFPAAHTFEYELSENEKPGLNPVMDWPRAGTENHIRAEQLHGPNPQVDIQHLRRAFERLVDLFPRLDLKPEAPAACPGNNTGPNADICGIQVAVGP